MGSPLSEVYWPGDRQSFALVPQYFSCEGFGYNAELVSEPIDSYAAMFSDEYAGRVAIWNDAIWTIGLTVNYLTKHGLMMAPERGPGDLTQNEVDEVIRFLRRLKNSGQFRAFWTDYSEVTGLLASGEVAVCDAWIPAFENARRLSGARLSYVNPHEGNRSWFHGLGQSAFTSKVDEVAALANWRLDGWFGAQIAPLGYYSPTTTVESVLSAADFERWYGGLGRDSGSYDERTSNVAFWPGWPSESDYYFSSWSRFLAS